MRRKRARRRDSGAQETSGKAEQEDSVAEDEGGADEEEASASPTSAEVANSEPQAQAEEEVTTPEISSEAAPESASETSSELPASQGSNEAEATSPEPEDSTTEVEEPQVGAAELEALGRELERSLSGGIEPDPPQRGGGIPNIEAPPPPVMNATPEDILGVPTQSFGMEKEPDEPQKPAASAASVDLAKQGGSPPMEGFEERAQMASEVLRATGHTDRRHRIDMPSGDAPPDDDSRDLPEDDPSGDDDDRNVRFSEDVTISSKRKRKLFGR
jgi:hypothetical protein